MDEKTKLERVDEKTKLEYSRAADRYNELYKAVWQNFSYMAVLSGALLTFGKDAVGQAALVACVPLLVWYWATYEPLDRYGVQIEEYLVGLEGRASLGLYSKLFERFGSGGRKGSPSPGWVGAATVSCLLSFMYSAIGQPWPALSHTLVVISPAAALLFLLWTWCKERLHVRTAIRLCAAFLHIGFAFLLGDWWIGRATAPHTVQPTHLHWESDGATLDVRGSSEQVRALVPKLLGHGSAPPPRDGAVGGTPLPAEPTATAPPPASHQPPPAAPAKKAPPRSSKGGA